MSVTREQVEAELAQLDQELADPAVAADPRALGQKAKRKADLETHLGLFDEHASVQQKLADAKSLAEGEGELAELAQTEVTELETRLKTIEADLEERAHPPDPEDAKNAILEIRAGAGGDEASLFAGDLYGMYQRYAEKHGLRVEVLSSSPSEAGGYKEIIFKVDGDGAYGLYRFEGGTHRVQRIPVTESGGRIHTSTATVAVLPEAEEVEFEIKPDELRIDVFRSSGPGGQSVNTTDSAVRITHLPTGLTVSCQDEKSQHKNKAKALSILRSRLKQQHDEQQAEERGDTRRQQVGTGDRSEKIRTYNFPQDRVTDHRIKVTAHGVQKLLAGGLDDLVAKLREAAREQS